MRMQKLIWVIGLMAAGLAYGRGEIVPIQDIAQGQSLVAGHLGNDALYSNPSASAFTSMYSVEGTFRSKKDFAASIMDTRTSSIGGGMGYFRAPRDFSTDFIQGLKLGFAWKASPTIGIGVAGKHIWGDVKNPADPTEITADNFKDIDLGAVANLGVVQLGITSRNIFGGEEAFQENNEHAFGARINYKQLLFLSMAAHTNKSLSPYQFGIGAEYASPYHFALKAGYRHVVEGTKLSDLRTTRDAGYWSLGASINSPKVALHYAVEFPSRDDEVTSHNLALAFLL
jgi:hypothetical protein